VAGKEMPLNKAEYIRSKRASLLGIANWGTKTKSVSTALSIVIVILVGCSADPVKEAPLRSDVERRMNSYNALGSSELKVDIGRTGTKCFFPFLGEKNEEPMDIGYTPEKDLPTVVAVKAGLVSVTPAGKDWWDVSLTEKGKAFFQNEYGVQQFHRAGHGCDEYDVTLLVARASVVDVSAPKIHEDTPGSFVYDYKVTSKWRITDLGKALQSDGDIYRQLTAEQRQELEKSINISEDLHQGPKFTLPAPHESENQPYSVIATYKKENGSMGLQRVRNE
jgi:hypothetical protein